MSMNRAGKATGWDSRIGMRRELTHDTTLVDVIAWAGVLLLVVVGAMVLYVGMGLA